MINKKIGVMTFHNVYNYGGMLQAYALIYALNSKGAVCIDYIQEDREKHYNVIFSKDYSLKHNLKNFVKKIILKENEAKNNAFKLFMKEYLPITNSRYSSSDDLDKLNDEFDVFISGSDQIWNPIFSGGAIDLNYLLEFSDKTKKVAYGSSAGSYLFSELEKETLANSLNKFQHIGVREAFLQEQLNSSVQKKIATVLDPTLLLRAGDWRKISKPMNIKDDYVLLYSFDNNESCLKIANIVAKKLKCKVLTICPKLFNNKGTDIQLKAVGPREFIWLFENSKFVVTNSFHGTCFSVNFRKNFFSIYKKSNPYRVLGLLDSIGLSGRIVKEVNGINSINWQIDYNSIEDRIEEVVSFSNDFLAKSIK